ncbi:uncharacterized protein DS421_9g275680 [Arachis hypogaea]|nr:uncharacterized protein DS421_9g275680 [Arachis hypogaea]
MNEAGAVDPSARSLSIMSRTHMVVAICEELWKKMEERFNLLPPPLPLLPLPILLSTIQGT